MKIEKDIPMPVKSIKPPLADMAIGDSVEVPGKASLTRQYIYAYQRKNVARFVSKAQPSGGLRIWRTA